MKDIDLKLSALKTSDTMKRSNSQFAGLSQPLTFFLTTSLLLLSMCPNLLAKSPLQSLQPIAPAWYRYERVKTEPLLNLISADFNGDGIVDIAGLNLAKTAVVVMFGKGRLEFEIPQRVPLSSKAQMITAIDFSGDGATDLLALTEPPEKAQALVSFSKGNKAEFRKVAEQPLDRGAIRIFLATTNLNAEKKLKLFSLQSSGSLAMIEFSIRHGFTRLNSSLLHHPVSMLILPEAMKNAQDFFSFASTENTVWLNRSPPMSPFSIKINASLLAAATADLNKNAILDLLLVKALPNQSAVVQVIYDVGVETGATMAEFNVRGNPTQAWAVDMNGDGQTDIALFDSDAGMISIFLCNKEKQFHDSYSIALTGQPQSVMITDLDGSRKPELVFSDSMSRKLVVCSTREERANPNAEHIATSKEANFIASSSRSSAAIIYDSNEKILTTLAFERECKWGARIATLHPIVALWRRGAFPSEEVIALHTNPDAISLFKLKDNLLEKKINSTIASFGVAASAFWEGAKNAPSLVAVLDEKITGAVPQLLFYAIGQEPNPIVYNLSTGTPLNAEFTTAITGMTIGKRMFLARLVENKTQCLILIDELIINGNRLDFIAYKALEASPNLRKSRFKKIAITDFNGDEQPDVVMLSESKITVFLSESLYQPKQIATFARLSDSDMITTVDINFDGKQDIVLTCHLRNEVFAIKCNQNGRFQAPKILLRNVWATNVSAVKARQSPALLVGNSHLHTIDLLRPSR